MDRVMDWLLGKDQPAVRYQTLTDILGYSSSTSEARQAFSEIPRQGWAFQILRAQKPAGHWESRTDLYRPKYRATIWRLIVLADLGLTARDIQVRRTCELFLNEYSRPDGGFDTPGSKWSRSEHCLTGNLARTLLLCGYGDDNRVSSAIDWLVETQMEDGGWHCFYERAFGRGTLDCWEGLSAFAVLPKNRWTRNIKRSVEKGAEFFLKRQLYRQGSPKYQPWLRFHYPNHYYYDLLVGLDIITKLGYSDDKRLKFALSLLKKKRRPDGAWALDAIHPDIGRGANYPLRKKNVKPFALEKPGQPSKWITLSALRILKRVEEAS